MNETYVKLVSKEEWESLDCFLIKCKIAVQYNKLNDHFREYIFSKEERAKLPHDYLGYYIEINNQKRTIYKRNEE